jgi:predicted nucleotidyltransferase
MAMIINEEAAAMLCALEQVLRRFEIDFYIVGAVARDIRMGGFAHTRKTNDVDIAIRVGDEEEYNALKAALIATGNFTAHDTEAIKLYYKQAIELDLLPFGEIEGINREITLHEPRLFSINMPGFSEAFPFTDVVKLEDIGGLKVCSLEGLVLLKLIAYDDRPERTKDVSDIDHMLQYFFEINEDNIYDDHYDLMTLYDEKERDYLQMVGAHVVGRKLKKIIGRDGKLLDRVTRILRRRPTR